LFWRWHWTDCVKPRHGSSRFRLAERAKADDDGFGRWN